MSLANSFLKFLKRFILSDNPIAIWLKAILFLACLIPAIVFASNATNSRDWQWYSAEFEDRPNRIIIYHGGEVTDLQPGQPGFNDLAEAVRASLAGGVDQQSNVGLSDQSRQEAYTRYTTVEAFFDRQVKLHAWFFTGHPTQMLFPITGRHSDRPVVFLGEDGDYRVNAPFLKTIEPLLRKLKALGYLE